MKNIITRTLSAIGLERRSTNIGVNGWPIVPAAGAVMHRTAQRSTAAALQRDGCSRARPASWRT
ncbi:MAG: hypothetical protein OJJ21_04870 [Ferrovibrio sp.]|uniref:hypothetical protein n=1 Tax=Ferrovibrio sp. TaxID=1917215 RepID=UPI00261E282C|nr:hypothetical protein [Ferrovibrio sp.]MCW0232912.1 hypothetical protein [Ferrovibrio sp.]